MMDYVSICTLAVLAEETDENLTEILHSRLMEQLESSFDYKKSKGPHQGATTSDLLHAVAKKIAVKCYQVVRTRLTYGNFDMASTITKAVIWNLAKKKTFPDARILLLGYTFSQGGRHNNSSGWRHYPRLPYKLQWRKLV